MVFTRLSRALPVNAVAPTDIQKQTCNVYFLLQNERDYDMIEHDGPEDENSGEFDPVTIASKLRELGDDYDEKVIQPLIKNVQKAATDQVSLTKNITY